MSYFAIKLKSVGDVSLMDLLFLSSRIETSVLQLEGHIQIKLDLFLKW